MTTEEVLNHHLEAFSEGSADKIMEDFTDESVLIIPEATLTGKEIIHGAFTEFFGSIFKPGTYEFTMDRVEVSGDIAYIIWHATTSAGEVKMGTDTLYVKDGKIAVQTFAMYVE